MTLSVDPTKVAEAVLATERFRSAMDGLLEALHSEFAPAFDGAWTGEAAAVCRQTKDAWQRSMENISQTQQTVGQRITQAADSVAGADRAAAMGLG